MSRRGLVQTLVLLAGVLVGEASFGAPAHPGAQASGAQVARGATRAANESEARRETRARHRGALRGVANLNEADEATLTLLPGIGEERAKRIVEYRRAHPFKHAEEVTRVRGIGRKTFARLKPFVSVAGATTLAEAQ